MAKVFLSYARADRARIEVLAAALERAGHEVWWDRQLVGGSEFSHAIEAALEGAQAVVVAWSETSAKSPWVRDEAAAGRDQGRLVPVTLDGVLPPLGFRQYHTIDLSGWPGPDGPDDCPELSDAISAKANETPSPRPAAVARPAGKSAAGQTSKGKGTMRIAVALGVAAAVGLGAYGAYRLWPKPVSYAVQVTDFEAIGADVPAGLADSVESEMKAAFAEAGAVKITDAEGDVLMRGDVKRVGDKLRYNMEVKNAADGTILWSLARERPADAATAPREFALDSTEAVRCALGDAASHKGRLSTRTLSLYLRLCGQGRSDDFSPGRALDLARQITTESPDFSYGWSTLASLAAYVAQTDKSQTAALTKEGEAAANRAIKLNPKNGAAYAALSSYKPKTDLIGREELLKKAVSVRPSDCGCEYQSYASFLAGLGRLDDAARAARRAVDQQPASIGAAWSLASKLYVAGRGDEGDRAIARFKDIYGDQPNMVGAFVQGSMWKQDWAEAERRAAKLPAAQQTLYAPVFAALKSGDAGAKARAAAPLKAMAAGERNAPTVANLLAALGETDAALTSLERLFDAYGADARSLLFDPLLKPLRNEPRFAKLIERSGLPAYWKAGGAKPDLCAEAGAPGFCGGSA